MIRRNVWKSNQSSMWNVMQVYQLPEVRIDRDQDSAVCFCEFQQSPISWVWPNLPGFDCVVSVTAEPLRKTNTCTPIYEKSHEPAIDTEARESPAMTARA